MKKGKSRWISLAAAAALLVSSMVFTASAEPAAGKSRYPVPDFDFSAEGGFLGNSNEKKPTWCSRNSSSDANAPTRATESCMFGKSAKLVDDSQVNTLFVDLYDDYALPAGDYILQAFAKTDNVVLDSEGANDQGLRLMAINWKTDDSTLDTKEEYSTNLKGTTNGWTIMEMPFTVAEGVSTVRIGAKMNNSKGTAYVTRFTIRPADQYYTVRNGGFEEFADFNAEFVKDAGPANAVDNEKWGAWCNYPFTAEKGWDSVISLADTGYQSDHSLRVTLDKNTVQFNIRYGSLVPIEPGKDYVASVWVKTENVVRANEGGTDQGAYLQVAFFNDKNDNLYWPVPDMKSPNATCGDTDWTQIVYRFTAPEGVSRVQIMPSMTASTGTVYFDNVEFKEAEPLPSDPIVAYPDFEGVEGIIRNDTPAGAQGDAIRYNWGAWYGKTTDGSPVEQSFDDAFSIVDEAPAGFSKSLKINAKSGTNYQLRQIIENLSPDMEYVLRAQVKTAALNGNEGASVGVAFLKEDKTIVWEADGKEVISRVKTGDSDWSDLYVKFRMPADTVDLFLYGSVRDCEGSVWFTNFELLPAAFYEEPGTDEPGTDEPGTDEPGTDEPGTDEPGTDVPKEENPEKTSASTLPITAAAFLLISAGVVVILKKRISMR